MLKACWDCLAGEQQRQTDDRYSVHMNGGSTATPWLPQTQYGKMFAIPTQLKENDEIIVKGFMKDGLLDIGLRPDANQYNIVCQLNVVYPQNQTHNQIVVRNVLNGTDNTFAEYPATDYFNDPTFEVRFTVLSDAMQVTIAESVLHVSPLQHSTDDMKYLSIKGEVTNLSFKFNP